MKTLVLPIAALMLVALGYPAVACSQHDHTDKTAEQPAPPPTPLPST